MSSEERWRGFSSRTRRRLVASVLTFFGAIVVETEDWIPLLDEALILFLLVRTWQWAGVDLSAFLHGRFPSSEKPKRRSRIIEID